MFADYHVHSTFSDDSVYPLEDICADAVRLGLDEICFTDHVDYGVKPDRDHPELAHVHNGRPIMNVDYERYFPLLNQMRARHAGELSVKRGLEFGVQRHTLGRYEALFDRWRDDLDFVILSIHQVGDSEFWNGDFQRGRSQEEYQEAYYGELLRVVERFDRYSVLGHLDLIRRYDPAGPYPFAKTRDLVAAILERVIATGHGIEVNTSSYRYGLDDLMPSTDVLRLYRDLGGRIVTLGSDSHAPGQLGSHIRDVEHALSQLGFTETYTFDRMEPLPHAIEG